MLKVKGQRELLELYENAKKRMPVSLIKDAGLTQVEPGEPTCIAIGPWEEKDIDLVTGKLKLL